MDKKLKQPAIKKLIILTIIATLNVATVFGQCTSLFSFDAYFETVTFINQSTVSNAHYFWNFGDGTGSNYQNPIHKFPETGNYLVTLFAKDTISNCSTYYEYWVNANKYSTDSCQTSITDSIFYYNTDYYLKIIDNSVNCNGYNRNYDSGPAQNNPTNNWISLGSGWHHARFLTRVQYYTNDTINGYIIRREAYKTSPFLYTSSKNYGDCSANFEFTVVSEDTSGQRILFKAMNSTATYYEWEIMGFGNPIVSNNDTISQYYPFGSNNFWLVGLKTTGSTGCQDTLYQNILIGNDIQTNTSVNEIKNQISISIFPNPFSVQSTLQTDNLLKNATLTVDNYLGQTIKQITNISGQTIILHRDNLQSGLYFICLTDDSKVISTKKIFITD